jgi:hypothetical protein
VQAGASGGAGASAIVDVPRIANVPIPRWRVHAENVDIHAIRVVQEIANHPQRQLQRQ